jgi:ABC-type sugar transport system ATPase subunit
VAGVTVSNLVKTYPKETRRATDDVSLEIEDGEFVVLVGPSGCGKTTLLRMIAGLERPDSGSVYIDGRDVTYLPPRERDLSMVFQSYAIFPHLTVARNIGFGLTMRKWTRRPGGAGYARRRTCSTSATSWTATRRSSPAASASGWRWPGRSRWTRASC